MKTKQLLIRRFLLLLACFVVPAIVEAQNDYYFTNGVLINYSISNGSITLTQCSNPPRESLDIPSVINGLPVTSIGPDLFGNMESTGLLGVTIPDSITNIANGAFSGCSEMTNIMIGAGVVNIGSNAFAFCSSLATILVDPLNPAYSDMDGILFDKSQTTLVQFPEAITGSYGIPDTITNLGPYAFFGSHLTQITIGSGVVNIGTGAFYDCGFLQTIAVDSANRNYRVVGGVLFDENQTTLILFPEYNQVGYYVISNGVTSIGDGAFYFCSSLASITIPNSVTSIGDYAFYYCSSLSGLALPSGLTNIGNYAFWNCFDLTSITIPGGVKNIGNDAFVECAGLTNLTIENGVNSIGNSDFEFCRGLTNVTIPQSITTMEAFSLSSCYSLAAVYFEGNAPIVDSSAFNADEITAYYLPGTTGWTNTFDGMPTAFWFLPNPVILEDVPGFGVQSNGFGFPISWATNASVVVDACTNLVNPSWSPVGTNTLNGGTACFRDAQWPKYPSRFYRVHSP